MADAIVESWTLEALTKLDPEKAAAMPKMVSSDSSAQISLLNLDGCIFIKNVLNKYYTRKLFDLSPALGIASGFSGDPHTYGFSLTKHC
jgi:hypothetical protein